MNIPTPQQERSQAPEARDAAPRNPLVESRELLLRAATLAAQQDVDLDAFMRAAWQSYMEARPGLREQLEDLQLAAQIQELRQAGKLGEA